MTSQPSGGYIQLLKSNIPFRNLWCGQVISELGDWLNSIAIYSLILQLGGGGMAMSMAMIAKLLPVFFVSPVAGILADRISRKKIMIATDLLRFVVVLGFLFVQNHSHLWLLYLLTVVEISLAGFFEPARSALIPSLTAKKDLVTANALSGSTWSVMLALGAALGGGIVGFLGIKAAFIIDSITFLWSAWFIAKIKIPENKVAFSKTSKATSGLKDFLEGARYLTNDPLIFAITLLKSGLAISGGILTMIPLYANKIFNSPSKVSFAIGFMYCARGLGAALGPIVVKKIFGETPRVLQLTILAAFFLGGLSLILLGQLNHLVQIAFAIGLLTFFASTIWVFSTALIHLEAQDHYLGRIFSTEMALLTLVMSLSNWFVGWSAESLSWSLSQTAVALGLFYFVPGILWGGTLLCLRKRCNEKIAEKVKILEAEKPKVPPTSV